MRIVPALSDTLPLNKIKDDLDFIYDEKALVNMQLHEDGKEAPMTFVQGCNASTEKKLYFRLRLQATGNCLTEGEFGYYLQSKFVSNDDLDGINSLEEAAFKSVPEDFSFKNIFDTSNNFFIKLSTVTKNEVTKFRTSFCPEVDISNLESSKFTEGVSFDMLAEPVLWLNFQEKKCGVTLKPVIISIPGEYPEVANEKKPDPKRRRVVKK